MSITIAAVGQDNREVSSINWNNGNAAAVLGAIGITDVWSVGAVSGTELGTWRQRIIRALNTDVAGRYVRPESSEQGGRLVGMGLDEDGLKIRLRALDEVLAQAQRLGLSVMVF